MPNKLTVLLIFMGGAVSLLTLQTLLGTHAALHWNELGQGTLGAVAGTQLDQALHRLQLHSQQLERRVSALEKSERSRSQELCTLTKRLGNLSSRAAMLAAGWQIDMDEVHMHPLGFTGWKGGKQTGALTASFQVSGKVFLRVENPHDFEDPLNKVYIRLNHEPLTSFPAMQTQELCLKVQAGDELRIEETFGQVRLHSFDFDCSQQAEIGAQTPPMFGVAGFNSPVPCTVGQQVWYLDDWRCDLPWIPGKVERALNESLVVVEVEASFDRDSRFIALPVQRLFTAPKPAAARCASVPFQRASIELVTVADASFARAFAPMIKSQRCYAEARGYRHTLLEPGRYEACKPLSIMFAKPCFVAHYLAEQPDGHVVAFLDADIVALVLDRGLEEWLRVDADLHFYEREFLPEVMSGVFLIRNKPWVRSWLVTWSNFFFRMPPGFSSADNGALHQHLVETIGLHGSAECGKKYAGLVSGIENRTPYWDFVECTNALLGPPATHKMCASTGSNDCGLVTIWPRLNFFVIDCFILGYYASVYVGPVFLHGVKKVEDVVEKYYRNVNRCEVHPSALRSREEYGQLAVNWGKFCPQFFPTLSSTCSQCVDRCAASFTCEPLALGEDPREVLAAKQKVDLKHLP